MLSANPPFKCLDSIDAGQKINGLTPSTTQNYFEIHIKNNYYPQYAKPVNLMDIPDPKILFDHIDYSIVLLNDINKQSKNIDYVNDQLRDHIHPRELTSNKLVFYSQKEERLEFLETAPQNSTVYAALVNQLWGKYNSLKVPTTPLLTAIVLVFDLDHDGIIKPIFLKKSLVLFDVNRDGRREFTDWISNQDGFLVVDLNRNGVIDHIAEIFSEYFKSLLNTDSERQPPYNSGLQALSAFDNNKDGKITARDRGWLKLQIWKDINSNGQTDQGELQHLDELGIQAIELGQHPSSSNGETKAGSIGFIRNGKFSKIFSYKITADPFGQLISLSKQAGQVTHSDGTATHITLKNLPQTLLADAQIKRLVGGPQNDTLQGDDDDNWLIGGPGSDRFYGGDGDDVLIIDRDDLQEHLRAGSGVDIIYAIGNGTALSLADTQAEIFIGSRGNDLIAGGTNYSLFLSGGAGNDQLIGGAANDVIHGGAGNDLLEGGLGNDLLRGGSGNDHIIGDAGNDLLEGGLGQDYLYGGKGDDILQGGPGEDFLYGDSGIDLAIYNGILSEYRITKFNNSSYRIVDTRSGRDGVDWLYNIEILSFKDLHQLKLEFEAPVPFDDTIFIEDKSSFQYIPISSLLANDLYIGSPVITDDQTNFEDISNSPGCFISISDFQGVRILGKLMPDGQVIPVVTRENELKLKVSSNYYGQVKFKYQFVGNSNCLGIKVTKPWDGETEILQGKVTLLTPDSPTDLLYSKQTYLTAIQVLPVWKDYTGRGIQILQLESTILSCNNTAWVFDYQHVDLQDNVDKVWLHFTDPNVFSKGFNRQATFVAGIIAAARNNYGTIGIAYNARLAGHCMSIQSEELLAFIQSVRAVFQNYDIVNHDGLALARNLNFLADSNHLKLYILMDEAFHEAIHHGRNGLGTITVSGGHGQYPGGDINTNSLSMMRTTITTAAIHTSADSLLPCSSQRPFSGSGASIFVAAPCGSIWTTGHTSINQDGTLFGMDTEFAEGASFSTPIVSGVVALVLEANPELGWRDVQHILALSATRVNDLYSNVQYNHADYWNGGGFHVSHDYGFGQINAHTAVRLAETWRRIHIVTNERILTQIEGSLDTQSSLSPIEPIFVSNGCKLIQCND